MGVAHGLPPAERVRRRPEFERAYDTGARIHGRFLTLFIVPNGLAGPRLGVAATRKLGSATIRNRAKRLVREVFRQHKLNSGLDIIVVPRREMLDAPFSSLEADYLATVRRYDPGRSARPRAPRAGRERRARSHSRV